MPEEEKQIISNQQEASEALGISLDTLRKWRSQDDFHWGGASGYDIPAIREWAAQHAPQIIEERSAQQVESPPVSDQPTEQTETRKRGRQGGQVVCPYCHLKCRAGRSEPLFTRYYCPEQGCSFSAKVPRPELINSARPKRPSQEVDYGARD